MRPDRETAGDDADRIEVWRRAEGVFDRLLDLPAGERLDALAAQADALGPDVVSSVRRLLDADDADGPLDRALDDWIDDEPAPSAWLYDDAPSALAGRRVGPYAIEREIGRGGMSVVFLARRVAGGYEQQVALKILTLAATVGSAQRIEREIEILARLRHPQIATLIDAGVEPDGTRWLAMEWIEGGRAIDRHDDDGSLLGARRLVELLLEVCDAVSHAHRSLVVHRDLKPSNILIDREGHVRLLDFGIAKLLDEADDDTSRTRALTPAFAAPEQFTGEPVTTATDVFALGGVLYRLLTGRPPRDGADDTATTIGSPRAAQGAAPGIDRDLETVVHKCLRHEPERRYPTAFELRQDLERWLARRPVAAMPDTPGYRLRKFVARNRTLTGAGVAVTLTLAAGLGATLWQAERARSEATRATAQAERASAVTEFVVDLFELAEPDRSQGESLTVRQALDAGARRLEVELADQPAVRAELLGTIGETYRRLGLYDDAVPLLEAALAVDGVEASTRLRTALRRARLAIDRSDLERAEDLLREPLAADDPTLRIAALETVGGLRLHEGRFDDAAETFQQARSLQRDLAPDDLGTAARLLLAQADAAAADDRIERASSLYEQALEATRAAHVGDHTQVARALHAFGAHCIDAGDPERAVSLLEQALDMRRRLLGEEHPDVAYTLFELAMIQRRLGRFDSAEATQRRVLELQRRRLGDRHPAVLTTLNSLALLDFDRGRLDEAAAELEDVARLGREAFAEGHPDVAVMLSNLAAVERSRGRLDRSEQHLLEAADMLRRATGEETLDIAHVYGLLGNVARARGDLEAAAAHYRRAFDSTLAATGTQQHPRFVPLHSNLAGVAFEQGLLGESADGFERAHRLAVDTMAEDHPLRILVAARWARGLERLGRAAEALPVAEAAAATAGGLYPPEHHRRLEIEAIYGSVLRGAGRAAESDELLRSVATRLDDGATSDAAAAEVTRWRSATWAP
ncbi:MAG: serine/threonine-protein kinase [Acidobacteriota bacterium]